MERLTDGGDGSAPAPATGATGVTAPRETPRTVVVSPDQVWSEPRTTSPGPLAPEPAHQTFYAPLVLVLALSSVLLTLALVGLALVIWLKR